MYRIVFSNDTHINLDLPSCQTDQLRHPQSTGYVMPTYWLRHARAAGYVMPELQVTSCPTLIGHLLFIRISHNRLRQIMPQGQIPDPVGDDLEDRCLPCLKTSLYNRYYVNMHK